jgi:AGZA family xanthine/uracil permease-like MFS transporter
MFEAVVELKFDKENLVESIPAYLCLLAMPLFYSISEGICLGVISYVVIKLACGKGKEVTPLMYVLAVLFVLKYIFL